MYTCILVFLLCSWKTETLVLKLKDQKLQLRHTDLTQQAKENFGGSGGDWRSKAWHQLYNWERSGSVVECLTQDRGAPDSSLTGVIALWSLSKTHLS